MGVKERAKKDYATGTYTWFDLKRKYSQLTINEIFGIIFEVRSCNTKPDNPNLYYKK